MSVISGIKVRGVRIVADDRRERDLSSHACSANNKATLVRQSTRGEVERYIGRHGTSWVAGAALVASVPRDTVAQMFKASELTVLQEAEPRAA